MEEKIAIIGLGYVGIPLALGLAKKFPDTLGFDIDSKQVEALAAGIDPTREGYDSELKKSSLKVSCDPKDLRGTTFFIVVVPTPIDSNNNPDLGALRSACELIGPELRPGAVVVFESTVYPGVTEEFCGPILERASGLKRSKDFKLGYSPERVNPGDKEHTLEKILKVVSGEDAQALERIASVYEKVISAGIYRASSIKVAEAAKVIENTQRDLNIALMNELAVIFDLMQIRTKDVLDAASTKWNFLRFSPGLVGGHCIGVDPFYLTTKAEQLGYHPQVILAGRRINDGMGAFVAQRMIKLMVNHGVQPKGARVGVLGLTFKENVADLRNSRVPDIITELRDFGVTTLVHDPLADPELAKEEYGIVLSPWSELSKLDGILLAVSHGFYLKLEISELLTRLSANGVFCDVKSALDPKKFPKEICYWSL